MDGLTNNSPNAKPPEKRQQMQFDMLLGRARELMVASGEQWVQALKQDPVENGVMMGVQTLRSLAGMSTKAGQPVDPMVLVHVGLQLTKDIAALANACGAVPDEDLRVYLQDVTGRSMGEYLRLDAKDGLLSPKDKKAAAGMLAQMQGGGAPAPMAEGAPAPAPAPMEPEMVEEDPQAGADDPEMAAQLAQLQQQRRGAPQ